MAESYKKVYPGNWVERISAYPLPNPAFKANNRPAGDPHDRQQQGVLFKPGFIAVHKVGFLNVSGAVPAAPGSGDGITGYQVKLASPDTRGDDKPRADINGLIVPQGAYIYRCGLRLPNLGSQPGYFSSGAKDPAAADGTGLRANANAKIWLEAKATAPSVVATAGAITATGANTPSIPVGSSGEFAPGEVRHVLLTPVATSAELEFLVYASQNGIGSSFLGGVYVVAEVCYLVPDSVAGLSDLMLPGAKYAGYAG